MPKVLDELVQLLALEKIEENLFRGQSQDLGWGTVFGGQVLGQALSAAGRADFCLLARMHLYDPYWTRHAAAEQGFEMPWPDPYRLAPTVWRGRK